MGIMNCRNGCNNAEPEVHEAGFNDPKSKQTNEVKETKLAPFKQQCYNIDKKGDFKKLMDQQIAYLGKYISEEEFESKISPNIKSIIETDPLDIPENISNEFEKFECQPIEFKNGNLYHGFWNNHSQMEGYGKYYIKDENVLAEGIWIKGSLVFSRIFLPNDEIYIGEIDNSTFNGKGKYITKNYIYEGDFKKGQKDGECKITYLDTKTVYRGPICQNIITGFGNYIWGTNYEYQGELLDNKLNGKGVLIYNNEKYEGQFNNNKFHGLGKYTFKDGSIYEGDFVCGIKKGKGKYQRMDGFLFDGEWDNNLPHGQGTITYGNIELKSNWRNGKMVDTPKFEKGTSEDINQEDLNFNVTPGILEEIVLSNLNYDNYLIESCKFKPTNMPSFLEE